MYENRTNFVTLVIAFLFCMLLADHLFAADDTVNTKQKTYIFHTAIALPAREILSSRIQEAFRRLNLKAKLFISPTSQRALMLADKEGDGDAFRVPHIKKIDPENTTNLVQVPESILTMELAAYTKKPSFPVEGWKSLEKYHNGARYGAKILEQKIPGKRTFLPTTVQLVQMLDADRIDTMVEWNLVADSTIRNLKVKGIKKLSPPILVQPFYMYVHKKHQALVPELSKALRQMKADGFFDKVAGKREFVFYTGAQSPVKDILEGRLQEAFKRIGLKFRLVCPGSAQRALVLANEDGDGDANRVPGIKQIAPKDTENLVQIPEPVNSIRFYVYTKGTALSVNGYKSLANLRNGFRVGTKILEKNIPGERIMLPEATRLFQMLDDGRLDTVVEFSFVADNIIKENNYTGITRSPQPLVDLPAYSFINKKHQALIPEITEALKQMKADGTFEKIEEDVLRKYQLN